LTVGGVPIAASRKFEAFRLHVFQIGLIWRPDAFFVTIGLVRTLGKSIAWYARRSRKRRAQESRSQKRTAFNRPTVDPSQSVGCRKIDRCHAAG